MILGNGQVLKALLGGAGTIPISASYVVITQATAGLSDEIQTLIKTNGATPVTLVPDPTASARSQLKNIEGRNNSGGAVVLTFRVTASAVDYDIKRFGLDDGDQFSWCDPDTWKIFDAAGKLKTTLIAGVPGTITVEDSTGAPSFPGIDTMQFTLGVVSQPGAGKALFTPSASGGGLAAAYIL
jgi:hypothetical protein